MNPTQHHTYWHTDFYHSLKKESVFFTLKNVDSFNLVVVNECLIINLLNLNNNFEPQSLIDFQQAYQNENIKLVHLWEDVWLKRPSQVISRIKSLIHLNIRIHGRKTRIQKIAKPIADVFLNENHLQGAVSSRYKLGMFLNEDLVAVATFSALRKMKHTHNYTSAELIRFAVKQGFTINGGLSKLIKAFVATVHPNDIMSYADRDWSAGEAYYKLGFVHVGDLKPQLFFLDDELNRKLNKNNSTNAKNRLFNTGSLKFVLKF